MIELLRAAILTEVDRLVDEVVLEEDPVEQKVNHRLRETLLRISDNLAGCD